VSNRILISNESNHYRHSSPKKFHLSESKVTIIQLNFGSRSTAISTSGGHRRRHGGAGDGDDGGHGDSMHDHILETSCVPPTSIF